MTSATANKNTARTSGTSVVSMIPTPHGKGCPCGRGETSREGLTIFLKMRGWHHASAWLLELDALLCQQKLERCKYLVQFHASAGAKLGHIFVPIDSCMQAASLFVADDDRRGKRIACHQNIGVLFPTWNQVF